MNVYGDLSQSQVAEGNWQETEETYVEMSGGLMDTLQKSDSLKRSMDQSTRPMESSNLTEGYVDMNTLTRKRMEEALRSSSKKSSQAKTRLCAMLLLAIALSVIISIALSVATQMVFKYAIHDQGLNQPSFVNCSTQIAARCMLRFTDNNTYNCVTEAVPIEDKLLTAVGIQCVQINAFELSPPMITSLILEDESNKARCSCTVMNNSNNNSALLCGFWVSDCSLNNS